MEDPRRQVEEFAQEWAAAEQRGDVGFLEGGLTDEFVGRLIRMPVPGIRAGTEYDLLLVVRNEIGPVSVHPVVARTTLDNVVAFDGKVQGAPGPGEASFATLW